MKLIKFYFLTVTILLVLANLCFAQKDKNKTDKNRIIMPSVTVSGIKVVKAIEGDTVESLAKRYKVSVADVAKLNGLFTKSRLNEGREIRIPVDSNENTKSVLENGNKASSLQKKTRKIRKSIRIKRSKPKYKVVRAKLNDTVETLACRHNVSPFDVVKLNVDREPKVFVPPWQMRRIRMSGLEKLNIKTRLKMYQEIRIPLGQNYRCVNQISA